MAVREALAIADDLYEQRIHVASDCKTVVDEVKQGSSTTYGAIIHEIFFEGKAIMASFIKIKQRLHRPLNNQK